MAEILEHNRYLIATRDMLTQQVTLLKPDSRGQDAAQGFIICSYPEQRVSEGRKTKKENMRTDIYLIGNHSAESICADTGSRAATLRQSTDLMVDATKFITDHSPKEHKTAWQKIEGYKISHIGSYNDGTIPRFYEMLDRLRSYDHLDSIMQEALSESVLHSREGYTSSAQLKEKYGRTHRNIRKPEIIVLEQEQQFSSRRLLKNDKLLISDESHEGDYKRNTQKLVASFIVDKKKVPESQIAAIHILVENKVDQYDPTKRVPKVMIDIALRHPQSGNVNQTDVDVNKINDQLKKANIYTKIGTMCSDPIGEHKQFITRQRQYVSPRLVYPLPSAIKISALERVGLIDDETGHHIRSFLRNIKNPHPHAPKLMEAGDAQKKLLLERWWNKQTKQDKRRT